MASFLHKRQITVVPNHTFCHIALERLVCLYKLLNMTAFSVLSELHASDATLPHYPCPPLKYRLPDEGEPK